MDMLSLTDVLVHNFCLDTDARALLLMLMNGVEMMGGGACSKTAFRGMP